MELTGRIIAVMAAQSGVSARTGNSWMSQDYVIEVPGQYPKRCVFRIFGEDRIKQFNIQMNEDVTIQFDIELVLLLLLRSRHSLMLLQTHSLLYRSRVLRVVLTICRSKKLYDLLK